MGNSGFHLKTYEVAYKQRIACGWIRWRSMMYGRLKHRFRVATYKEIADERFAQVTELLHDQLRQSQMGERPAQGALF